MSQHNNNNADRPICRDSSRAAHAGSPAMQGRGQLAEPRQQTCPGLHIAKKQDGRRREETTWEEGVAETDSVLSGRHVGRRQVPRSTLMSCHYPVNTATHVVSDQLGRHKGAGWDSAGGSHSLLVTSRPLSLSLCISSLFVESGHRSKANERSGGGGGGGDLILHLAKDVKQGLQQTRPSLDL